MAETESAAPPSPPLPASSGGVDAPRPPLPATPAPMRGPRVTAGSAPAVGKRAPFLPDKYSPAKHHLKEG